MNRYVFAPAADEDLVGIYLYTAETWNRDQADRYTGGIVEACARIATGNLKGRRVDEIGGSYLKISQGSHFIVYRRDGDLFTIVRILHQAMDIPSRLQD